MRYMFGLRPRLLIAVVLTSAITLCAAALSVLSSVGGSSLQEKLRAESARSLRATVLASRGSISDVVGNCDKVLIQQRALQQRTNAQIFITRGERPRVSECSLVLTDEDPLYSQDIQSALTTRVPQRIVTAD